MSHYHLDGWPKTRAVLRPFWGGSVSSKHSCEGAGLITNTNSGRRSTLPSNKAVISNCLSCWAGLGSEWAGVFAVCPVFTRLLGVLPC